MPRIFLEEIDCIEKLTPDICIMKIKSEYIAMNATPGQFVDVKCCEGINALLRRPISICSVDREKKTFDIVFQLKGKGTEILAQKVAGDRVDIIGPLGRPFDISNKYKKIAVVGGGIGVFPLLFLLQQSSASSRTAFLGFRNKECAVLTDEFKKQTNFFNMATDDGSAGKKGFVTDMLKESLENESYDIIYACGPMPMLKLIAAIAEGKGIRCQVSLEQRMGCGIGACLVCACKTKHEEGWKYSHVCKDGPVFWSDEVMFEE